MRNPGGMNSYGSLKEIGGFFHASPRYFQPGTLLGERPRDLRSFPASGPWVYLTDSASVHDTIREMAKKENWYIFKVKPATKVYSGEFWDLVCKRAEVIACVGFARDYPGTSEVRVETLHLPNIRRYGPVLEYPS